METNQENRGVRYTEDYYLGIKDVLSSLLDEVGEMKTKCEHGYTEFFQNYEDAKCKDDCLMLLSDIGYNRALSDVEQLIRNKMK